MITLRLKMRKLDDRTSLALAFLSIIVLDLAFIGYGYFHGKMHLLLTLKNAGLI